MIKENSQNHSVFKENSTTKDFSGHQSVDFSEIDYKEVECFFVKKGLLEKDELPKDAIIHFSTDRRLKPLIASSKHVCSETVKTILDTKCPKVLQNLYTNKHGKVGTKIKQKLKPLIDKNRTHRKSISTCTSCIKSSPEQTCLYNKALFDDKELDAQLDSLKVKK